MNFDIETALEDALISLIKEYTGIKTVRWEDVEEKHLSPQSQISDVIKVLVTNEEELEGTYNLFAGVTLTVSVAVFASKRRDLKARNVNTARGVIRSVFAQSDIVDLINAIGDLVVYENGVIVQGSFDASDDKNYGKGITLQVVARPK